MAASPVIAQWLAAKEQQPDALLFFRMGDFYELFFDDAALAAAALGIALTARGEHDGKPIAMCGVPIHAAEGYLARLIRRGFRVAVAEQMEAASARTGKAPLRREIVRLVTPGTLTEESLLDGARPNLLLALARSGRGVGAAWLDISTGLFETEAVSDLPALLGRLDPAEILAPLDLPLGDHEAAARPKRCRPRRWRPAPGWRRRSARPRWTGSAPSPTRRRWRPRRRWPTCAPPRPARFPHSRRRRGTRAAATLAMDAATRASLEITRARDGSAEHTLLAAVSRTVTAPGGRMLAAWLSAPLTDAAAIARAAGRLVRLLAEPRPAPALRTALRGAPDATRALGRLSVGRGGPRDLLAVRQLPAPSSPRRPTARCLASTTAERACSAPWRDDLPAATRRSAPGWPRPVRRPAAAAGGWRRDRGGLRRRAGCRAAPARRQPPGGDRAAAGLRAALRRGLAEDPPPRAARLRDGGAGRGGRRAAARPELTLRQSMANAARFTNPELADLDRRINEAAGRAGAREAAIFAALVADVLAQAAPLRRAAAALATLDVLQACARLAEPGAWCRPDVTADAAFCVAAARHPVVEAALPTGTAFQPNDCDLSPARRVLLLTGPNMAGKSTFLRQNALLVILAQAGLPVPAAARASASPTGCSAGWARRTTWRAAAPPS